MYVLSVKICFSGQKYSCFVARGGHLALVSFFCTLVIVNSAVIYFDFVNVCFQLLKTIVYCISQTMDDNIYKDM